MVTDLALPLRMPNQELLKGEHLLADAFNVIKLVATHNQLLAAVFLPKKFHPLLNFLGGAITQDIATSRRVNFGIPQAICHSSYQYPMACIYRFSFKLLRSIPIGKMPIDT